MEHVNNDMDDLFKKAGDLYPLKTTGSDWDSVRGRLTEEDFGYESSVPGSDTAARRSRRRWLILLFLIPLGLGSVVYFSHSEKHPGGNSSASVDKNGSPDHTVSAGRTPPGTDERGVPNDHDKLSSNNSGKHSLTAKKTSAAIHVTQAGFGNSTFDFIRKEKSANSGNNLNNATKAGNGTGAAATTAVIIPIENTSSSKSEPAQTQDSKSTVPADSAASIPTKTASVKPVLKENANNTVPENASKAKTTNLNKGADKGFYIGLIGGPDLSTVKFQEIKQTGFSLGALVGYRISKRISIESGLIWDKKYYYSNGEYYKKSPPLPSSVIIDGNCNMFEIPLDFRYDFASGAKHGFFASAGLSSYLNMKENYSFQYSSYPNVDKSYDGPSNIFSIMQLSAGYEYAIGEKTKIRIEPYIKIPLAGVGTGSMPISSTGIYFGITRSFR
jgi:Outer membrane protein beta-barrel domain